MPATMLLEMSRPLNYLGAQALHFFTPFATILVEARAWETFAGFVERRGSVEYMIRLIDECEADHVPVDGEPGLKEADGVPVVDGETGFDGPADPEPRETDPESGSDSGDDPPRTAG